MSRGATDTASIHEAKLPHRFRGGFDAQLTTSMEVAERDGPLETDVVRVYVRAASKILCQGHRRVLVGKGEVQVPDEQVAKLPQPRVAGRLWASASLPPWRAARPGAGLLAGPSKGEVLISGDLSSLPWARPYCAGELFQKWVGKMVWDWHALKGSLGSQVVTRFSEAIA